MTVIGSCIILDELDRHFNNSIVSDKYLIAMQILLKNYCHFLQCKNGTGNVYLESRDLEPDKKVRMHFSHIKAMGSMYVSPYAMQYRLKEIHFPTKVSNNVGIQIADFVPNNFARMAAGKKKHDFNIYNDVRNMRYDGNLMKHNRFGVKIMP